MRADPIGRLISRRDLAMVRHRAALARELGLMDSELLALLQIAFHGELAPSSIGSLLDLSFVETPMTRPFLAEPGARAAIERQIPLGRLGTPDEVADAVMFAATSTLMTGASLSVDGGWTAS
jgi:hypothetical protein